MEKVKPKKRKRRNQESIIWRKILSKDLQLSELQLFEQTLSANMTTAAMMLERKRNPGDYVR